MAKWLWPCPGNTKITSGVGERWGTQHNGIDISAPKDATIVASREGVVTATYTSCTHNYSKTGSCGCAGGLGNYVDIDHKDGYTTRYAHMTSVLVNKGDRLSQGIRIGTVGSTGYSTGNHLHFEIKYNNVVQNPEKFVEPTNSTYVNPPSTNSSKSRSTVSYDTGGAENLGAVIPLSSRDILERQAFHAYIKFYIGDREIAYVDGKPSLIQRLELTRLKEAGDTANFVLFDDDWDSLEPDLAKNYNNIYIEYGYSEGNYSSPRYKMQLQDYSIDFLNIGTLLTINAVSQGVYENLKQHSHNTKTKNPSQAIRSICKNAGWGIDEENFVETVDIDREEDYKLISDNPISYIFNTIIPEALTRFGETVTFIVKNNVASLKANTFDAEDNEDIPTYVYQKGYDSPVISLSFNTKGIFGGTTQFETVTKIKGNTINTNTKTELTNSADIDSTLTVATGEYSSTLADQSDVNYTVAGETSDQISAILTYRVKNGADSAYEATMTILGDPTIELLQLVRIINITDSGNLHHTSGIYRIIGITDSIESGNFTTTLQLIRNGDISNGILMKSPKSVKK